jgi:hypothetical protein
MNDLLFILFPGFGSTKDIWGQEFISNLKKLGYVYTYTPKFYTTEIFTLKDINLSNHCHEIYQNIINLFGNKKKIILISHSAGSYYAYQFSKLYTNKIVLSIMLDPAFMGPVGKKRLSDKRFLDFAKEIKEQKYQISDLIKNKQTELLNKFVRHKIIEQVPVHFSKFPTPTIFFRNLEFTDDQGYTLKDRAIEEGLYFKKNDSNFKIHWSVNDSHYLFLKKNIQDLIIMEIKNYL